MFFSRNRDQVVEVDFDRVLSTMQGWLCQELMLSIESSSSSFETLTIHGALIAAPDITEPLDFDEFGFLIADCPFSLHRGTFIGASHYPDAEHLEVEQVLSSETILILHLLRLP
jgi:protoporphyrinogen oxidase